MLARVLEGLGADRPLWVVDGENEITVRMLTKYLVERDAFIGSFENKRVAIYVNEPVSLALLLLMLDGRCKQLLILPSDISFEQRNCFIRESISEILITNTEESFGISSVKFSADLFELNRSKNNTVFKAKSNCQTEWLIPTSGTTGTPKLVRHTTDSLCGSINKDSEKGRIYRWGLLYQLSRFAGLQVFLQSFVGGSCLVFTGGNSNIERSIDMLLAGGCNALSATPTMWRRILMSKGGRLLKLKQITLGGEIVDQALLTALSDRYKGARIIHIYASTEAGVGFVVADGLSGFPQKFLSHPPNGVELYVKEGYLYIRSRNVTKGYLNSVESLFENDGFMNTGDLVKKVDDRYQFLGRANGAINVGGNKVQPEEVELILKSFPGVILAKVGAKASPITGSLVEAKITLENQAADIPLFKKELKDYCKGKLAAYKVPALIKVVDDLPLTAAGKLSRG